MNRSKFRPGARFKTGFIANLEEGELSTNRFGGVAWAAKGPRPDLVNPVLLVTVDLAIPALSRSVEFACNLEIPLFSYINLDGIIPIQEYQLDHETKTAVFKPFFENVKLLPIENRLMSPLPESVLRLRDMQESEISVDEETYWVAMDSFLGGSGMIRICGSPLYIDYISQENDGFSYFASIGYE